VTISGEQIALFVTTVATLGSVLRQGFIFASRLARIEAAVENFNKRVEVVEERMWDEKSNPKGGFREFSEIP
jgi:hypothetical protein